MNILLDILEPYRLNLSTVQKVDLVQSFDSWPIENENVSVHPWRHWTNQNWTISLRIAIIYIVFVLVGPKWMKNRRPFDVHRIELLWNFGMALFSFVGALGTWPSVYEAAKQSDGFYQLFCVDGSYRKANIFGVLSVWGRVIELGGTVFIILKKSPLIFLHPYHHVVVLLYSFYYFQVHDLAHMMFGMTNFSVHTLLYCYFVLKGIGMRVPRKVPLILTGIQLSEMFCGIYINLYGLFMKKAGVKCDRDYAGIYGALTMYATFFLLFVKLFYDSYWSRTKNKLDEYKTA